MLNKTDIQILELCSTKFSYLSGYEIAKGTDLHITTVGERLDELYKSRYLIKKKSGRGFSYRFNFDSENARKFRLFIDMDFVFSLKLNQLDEFIKNNRSNQNIISCLLYGSSLKTKSFNDIDLLVVYNKEPEEASTIFDIFQMDVKTFRNLYSLGEPRLQSALTTGRILIDREFIFNYFENDLPIKTDEEIVNQLKKKYVTTIKFVQELKKEKDIREKILEALQTKGIIEFISNRKQIPPKTEFEQELEKINPELHKLILKIKSAKGAKQLWTLFYSEIL